jgi:RNA polymerase sigma factor (sigma-70 family)
MRSQLRTVLGQLQRSAKEQAGGLTDAELLCRFTCWRDEAAFEALVWRHGAMVLGVCRRVLRHAQDAEDAFQATFLVFARAAGSITRQESVGGWLYRVASRVARRARARAARRAAQELPDVPLPAADPASEAVWRDLRPVLDEEVARRPAKYRVPFVLCYLEGRTNEQAARDLGWPKGTVATRLAGARQRMRARLARRGLAPSAVVLAAVLAGQAGAAPAPMSLVLATAGAALKFAADGAAAKAGVSIPVAHLTRGALRSMFLSRLNAVAAVLVAAGLILTAASAAAYHLLAGSQDAAQPPGRTVAAKAAPAQAAGKPAAGKILFYRAGHLTFISPDGKEEKRVSQNRGEFFPGDTWLSPDGKRYATLIQVERNPPPGRDPRRKVYVRGLDEAEPGIDLGVEAQRLTWSPDSKQLVAVDFAHGDDPKSLQFITWLVDVATRNKTQLKLPEKHFVCDWSRDGKYFLTTRMEFDKNPPTARLCLVSRDGTEVRELTDGKQLAAFGRLSPDGRKVLYLGTDPQRAGKAKESGLGLFVLDIRQRKATRVEGQPLNGDLMGFCWSPDGKRIAYGWREQMPAPGQQTESHLVVADADGRNSVTIATERGDSPGMITIGASDWR